MSLTDTVAEERWLSADGGLGICFRSIFCKAGRGGDGALWTFWYLRMICQHRKGCSAWGKSLMNKCNRHDNVHPSPPSDVSASLYRVSSSGLRSLSPPLLSSVFQPLYGALRLAWSTLHFWLYAVKLMTERKHILYLSFNARCGHIYSYSAKFCMWNPVIPIGIFMIWGFTWGHKSSPRRFLLHSSWPRKFVELTNTKLLGLCELCFIQSLHYWQQNSV